MISSHPRILANKYSIRSLINSLARDYSQENFIKFSNDALIVEVNELNCLTFELAAYSPLGGHRYSGKILFNNEEVSFDEMLPILCERFNEVDTSFIDNVLNSRNNMELILREYENRDIIIDDYLSSEQLMLLGHPFHPYPKCKNGMNEEDMRLYSPEFKNEFNLIWLKCHSSVIYTNGEILDVQKAMNELANFDLEELEADYIHIPMHPWQWSRLAKKNEVEALLQNGLITKISQGRRKWCALSSLRSLYSKDAPYLVKYSMDVKLTNSIRHLQPEEAIRGMQMETVFKNEKVDEFSQKFEVLYEPFYVALKNNDGSAIIESTIQLRENFASDNCLLLATLAEENPYTGKSHLATLVEENAKKLKLETGNFFLARKNWFSAFLENVVGEFIKLSEEHGVLLGAHMQNIILRMKDGLPIGAVYRDCQGTGFTSKSVEKFGKKYDFISKTKGNILNPDDVNKVYTYYLIINSVFNTIISLANGDKKAEIFHLNQFRNFIFKGYKESSFLKFLLESETLFQKGNFRCSITNINENTIANPWDIYNQIENPIVSLLRRPRQYQGTLYECKTHSGQTISLRAFDLDKDIDKFHEWHNKEYIYEFWEMNFSKDELAKYIQGLKSSPFQLPIIVDINGQQAGYFEVYWAFDDRIAPYCDANIYDRGIHILIGEEKYLRTKAVYESIFHLTKFIFEDDKRTQSIWGEPREDNKKVLKLAELLPGWSHEGVFDFPHKRSNLLKASRELFNMESTNE